MIEDPRDPGLGPHLSPEELAVLAEGGDRGRSAHAASGHLARCRSCMSAYADIVRYRAAWLAFPEAFGGGTATPPNRFPWVAAAGVIVLMGIAVAMLAGRERAGPDHGPITALIESASAEGLVIPGGEAGAAGTESLYRSGPATGDDVEGELERLRTRHESDPQSSRDIQQLAAGYLAAGRLDLAGDYVADGLARAPTDARLLTVAGIVAHRNGDFDEAERRLRAALRSSPNDLTAMLDLGLVLAETAPNQAQAYLSEVVRKAPRSPLADRARRVLAAQRRP